MPHLKHISSSTLDDYKKNVERKNDKANKIIEKVYSYVIDSWILTIKFIIRI